MRTARSPLSGTIVSPGGIHTNTVSIDWGDGSPATTIVLPPGVDTFSTPHTYLNNPAGVTSGSYCDQCLGDRRGGQGRHGGNQRDGHQRRPAVHRGRPELCRSDANEGDTVTLDGQFTDPGTLDPHTVTIDWGDGSTPTVALSGCSARSSPRPRRASIPTRPPTSI